MKIWLDDIRPKPHDFDIHFYSAEETLNFIIDNSQKITLVSFDNDLGLNKMEGYQLANKIEEMAFNNVISSFKWNIHSGNPVARKNIEKAMKNADRFWSKKN